MDDEFELLVESDTELAGKGRNNKKQFRKGWFSIHLPVRNAHISRGQAIHKNDGWLSEYDSSKPFDQIQFEHRRYTEIKGTVSLLELSLHARGDRMCMYNLSESKSFAFRQTEDLDVTLTVRAEPVDPKGDKNPLLGMFITDDNHLWLPINERAMSGLIEDIEKDKDDSFSVSILAPCFSPLEMIEPLEHTYLLEENCPCLIEAIRVPSPIDVPINFPSDKPNVVENAISESGKDISRRLSIIAFLLILIFFAVVENT